MMTGHHDCDGLQSIQNRYFDDNVVAYLFKDGFEIKFKAALRSQKIATSALSYLQQRLWDRGFYVSQPVVFYL